MDPIPPNLPVVGQSGIAFDINAGGHPIPDLKEKRRGLAFAKVSLLIREDAAPLPGWEAYPV
jgi:hypothetical protein